jgi:hypothetical protein
MPDPGLGSEAMRVFLWSILVLLLGLTILAVFVPVYSSHGYPSPERATCLSNLKQIATAQFLYASDYDDRFPDRDVWMDVVFPYIKNQETYHCPAFQKKERKPEIYGYCFNAELSRVKLPTKSPELIPLAFDSVNLARSASGSIDSLPSPGRHKSDTSDAAYNMVAYADGHAKSQVGP